MHMLGRFLTGYGGKVAPPFSRYYTGGENDIRGFEIWGISPIAFLPSSATVNVLNNDGTPAAAESADRTGRRRLPERHARRFPIYQLVFPGGDTNVVTNFEYRIPIVGPVTLAYFFDAGIDKLSLPSQLKLNPGRVVRPEQPVPAGRLCGAGGDCARDSEDPRFHRSGTAGADAGGECAVPVCIGRTIPCCSAATCSRRS